MDHNIYGKFDVINQKKKDGSTEPTLSTKLNSQISLSVNVFNGVVYVHINKREKKYYLPLTLDEYQDLTDLRITLEDSLHLISQAQKPEDTIPTEAGKKRDEQKGATDVRHVVERRMHPYRQTNPPGAIQTYADEFDQYLNGQQF
ncbi:uncharacterized protein LOC117315668 [Pecten maximus]|uniref:uncharacterized protein LOC117315668 n=1 Tax=Pecten maximus TaxID=6579 RepID=UPI001458193A|nr:uncharacterized protein LOC117315668 [Pecten maximus]